MVRKLKGKQLTALIGLTGSDGNHSFTYSLIALFLFDLSAGLGMNRTYYYCLVLRMS